MLRIVISLIPNGCVEVVQTAIEAMDRDYTMITAAHPPHCLEGRSDMHDW